jgi:hypothetical protein
VQYAPSAKHLVPADYVADPALHHVVGVLCEEVEVARQAQRKSESPRPAGLLSPGRLIFPADETPWFEFAIQLTVLERCARRLEVTPSVVAKFVADGLSPPNWQTYFWLAAYLEVSDRALPLLNASIEAHRKHAQRALKRLLKQREGGKASGRSRAIKALAKPQDVLREYQKLVKAGQEVRYIAGKLGVKFNVSSDYIRAILRKHKTKPK